MEKPNPAIFFDPVTAALEIRIELWNIGVWGNNPPSGIAFFSLQNNYSWEEKSVLHITPVNPVYQCNSSLYDFNSDTTVIYFWLYDLLNNIDTVTSYTIIYNKPHVQLITVNAADSLPGTRDYVVYENKPDVIINAHSSFPSAVQSSFITKMELRDLSSPLYYVELWKDINGVQDITYTFSLPEDFLLNPGETRTFSLRATGKTDAGYTGPAEYSEEFTFTLTYLYLYTPDTICQDNNNISLTGYPPGGTYEGNGILNGTQWFNPDSANFGSNTVTYYYSIEGYEFSTSKSIMVINKPTIDLIGSLQVWENSTDVLYYIDDPDPNYRYKWTFKGSKEVLYTNDYDTCIIHWDTIQNIGNINIEIEPLNPETACAAKFEYIIDIDPDAVPDKPCICFGDKEHRLLLCSNTDAKYYKWFADDDSIGFSREPYFYLTDDLIKYHSIVPSTVFTIRIANQETGGYTTGYMCDDIECPGTLENSILINPVGKELVVTIQSNPVRDALNLKSSGDYKGTFDVIVYTMTGSRVFSSQLTKVMPEEFYEVYIKSDLTPGIYLVMCQFGQNRTAPIKMIVY